MMFRFSCNSSFQLCPLRALNENLCELSTSWESVSTVKPSTAGSPDTQLCYLLRCVRAPRLVAVKKKLHYKNRNPYPMPYTIHGSTKNQIFKPFMAVASKNQQIKIAFFDYLGNRLFRGTEAQLIHN